MNVVAFAQSSLLPYKNPVLSVDERVKDLLSRNDIGRQGRATIMSSWLGNVRNKRTMKYILLKSLKD